MISTGSVWVVGATSGIGRATAEAFLREGRLVVAAGRRVERLQELTAVWGQERLYSMPLDVRDEACVQAAMRTLPPAFSCVNVLVYCAGLSLAGAPLEDLPAEAIEQMLATNIHGLLHCVRAVLPGMRERRCGHILTVGSQSGNVPCPGTAVYGASKAFAHFMTQQLREDLTGTPIRVTSVEPGTTQTEFASLRLGEGHANAHYAGLDPLQPVDVAEAIRWAASCPPHVTVTRLQLLPTRQTCGKPHTFREPWLCSLPE